MAIVVRYNLSNVTREQYDRVNEMLMEELGSDQMPEGLAVHVLFGEEGDLKLSEIWDSAEQLHAFRETLVAVLEKAGAPVDPNGPEIFEVHNLFERSAAPAA